MLRTVSVTARQCSRLVRLPNVNRRGFALVNDYSVKKRMSIGLSGFAVAAVGCYYGGKKIIRNRKAKKMERAAAALKKEELVNVEPVLPVIPEVQVEEEEIVQNAIVEETIAEETAVEEVAAETIEEPAAEVVEEPAAEPAAEEQVEEQITEVDDGVYRPWWTGVKEVSLFLGPEETAILDERFPALRPYKPTRKVMLSYNPRPEDVNEFGPVMGDEVEVKVLAMVSDEHAQVLVVDIGNTESAYRYPHIVLSCDDEDRASAYSSVYGRLLVDRCVMDGLLVEDGANVYVPKEEVENVVIEGYYSYPETHVTVKDLREEGLVIKTKLCTARGLNHESFECMEKKNDRECAWCVFMKSGPCFKPFEVWQKCILKHQEDADSFIANCGEITMELKKCVDAHPEYYGEMSQPNETKQEVTESSETEPEPAAIQEEEMETSEPEVMEPVEVQEEVKTSFEPEATETQQEMI